MKNPIFTLTMLAFLGLSTLHAQVKVGNNPTSIDASAELEVESSTKGFLPPRMTTAQRDNIANPANGLMIFNTDFNCTEFRAGAIWINMCTGGKSPILGTSDVFNPVTGRIWMDRNLGASQVANSSTHGASYGDLYQWGRATDGHEKRNSPRYDNVLSTDGVSNFNNNSSNAWYGKFIRRNSGDNNWVSPSVTGVNGLWQNVNGTNNPCPSGYRLPTAAEWNAERESWASYNAAGAFASPLKLPLAGNRSNMNTQTTTNAVGGYWSSNVSGIYARYQYFDINSALMYSSYRAAGFSVRCIKH